MGNKLMKFAVLSRGVRLSSEATRSILLEKDCPPLLSTMSMIMILRRTAGMWRPYWLHYSALYVYSCLLLRTVSIITNKARNLQNDVIPVLAPFISASNGLHLKGFIHPETARGNSSVDVHLSVAMRHVQRFVRETEAAIATPKDIWRALNYDGGIRNKTAEVLLV